MLTTYLSVEIPRIVSSATPTKSSFPFDAGDDDPVFLSLPPSLLPLLVDVCILRLAVRTNWPTAAQNPHKNALKGLPNNQLSAAENLNTKKTKGVVWR